MTRRLVDSLAECDALADVFSDASMLECMLEFERALARAGARAGVIPASAAAAITAAARAESLDAVAIARDAMRAGTPVIPLVRALTLHARGAGNEAAGFLHWGATSQDVSDTALVLALRRARNVLAGIEQRLENALLDLSNQHASSVMLARTLLQPAPPTTFGLKAAGWRGGIRRSWRRAARCFDEAMMLQFGGASGTLAALGEQGPAVAAFLAEELGLGLPEAPWHAHRDRLGALLAMLGVYVGALGKMARDVVLLMQHEVGEAAERGAGGSSAMPHKRNPIRATVTLAAATRVPGLVASFLSGLVQEHERAAGAWQAELPVVRAVLEAAATAASNMAEAAENLEVFPTRMLDNVAATRGLVFAERAVIEIGKSVGRARAFELVEQAVSEALERNQSLSQALARVPEAAPIPADLELPGSYLGAAEVFRRRLLDDPE